LKAPSDRPTPTMTEAGPNELPGRFLAYSKSPQSA